MFAGMIKSPRVWAILALWHVFAVAQANVLQEISYSALTGNQVEIILTLAEPLANPTSFTTDNPARIAIDLPGTTSGLESKTKNIGVGVARSVIAIEGQDRTRVVINLLDSVPHTLTSRGNQLVVALTGTGSAGTMSADKADGPAVASARSASAARAGKRIENVDFRRGPQGEGRVEIDLSDPGITVDMRQQGNKVVLDFVGARLPQELASTLDVTDFATPVTRIETRPDGGNARMTISTAGEFEHLAYQTNDLYTVEFRSLTKQEKEALRREQLVYVGERLSLNFQDIEVRAVLQLLADFTGLNMVVSDTVGGRITLRLKNVPWDQAMDIILKTKGLSMRRNDNVILVAPTEEIAAREKLELESQQQIEELAPLRSNWCRSTTPRRRIWLTLLKSEENKLLCGTRQCDDRRAHQHPADSGHGARSSRRSVDWCSVLDIPVRQVLIESRIVIANNDFAQDLGSNGQPRPSIRLFWEATPGSSAADLGSTGVRTLIRSVFQVSFPPRGHKNLIVNLPQTLAPGSGGAINFLLGKVGSHLLQLELSAMQQEGKGEIISSPRVITSDQKPGDHQAGRGNPLPGGLVERCDLACPSRKPCCNSK